MELADTSAWAWSRRADQPLARWAFDQRLEIGLIATCDMVRLELLYSARSVREFDTLELRLSALPGPAIGVREWKRALSVYRGLAARGGAHQRSVKHADLLVAAAAECAGIPVLHYDEDFERIAQVTGQPHRWLAPRGSL
ncbi:MAG: PIN domain-containing protein [Actinomycetota bacterium]|nr:PIN domain-containing protein [Actinomycetota bacterium]